MLVGFFFFSSSSKHFYTDSVTVVLQLFQESVFSISCEMQPVPQCSVCSEDAILVIGNAGSFGIGAQWSCDFIFDYIYMSINRMS